ncbi:major facilitator superfamily protein [Sarocladium implicatum]|nr:major facilitator superfamily protein [Sarocladium implicatum]
MASKQPETGGDVEKMPDTNSKSDDGGSVKSINNENSAANFLNDHHAEWSDYTSEEAKKVLRKIDWRLMPLIVGTITLAAVDKIIISNASLYGMSRDTHLVGQQYSWVGSIFYFGWLIAEYPANAVLQKLPVGKTVGACVVLWGVLVMCLAAAQNAPGLMVIRFILGALEAPLFPAVTILNSMWYRKSEQPLRMALTFTGFSSLVTGIVSYGIGRTNTALAPWRLLFLVIGAFTLVWGVLLLWRLPDSPTKDNFLSGKDRYIALDRVKDNMTGIENKKLKWYQVREAFTDYKTYALFFFFLCINVPTGGLVTFAAQIVSGLGYSPLNTVLLGMPTGLFQSLAGFMVAVPQRWLTNKRCLSCALCCLIPLACSILLRLLNEENKIGRLVAYYFFYFFWGPYATGVSLPMANVSGHTKKLTINATVFFAYCIANIVGPQVFISSEAPHYTTGYNSILGFEIGAILCMAVYGLGCRWENKQRDAKEGALGELSTNLQLGDLTDYEKPGFRYVY